MIHCFLAALLLGVFADREATPDEQLARVESRVRRWQPTAEERRFDEIGWGGGIPEAIPPARRLGGPGVLFTHDGAKKVGRGWGGALALRGGPPSQPPGVSLPYRSFVPAPPSHQ